MAVPRSVVVYDSTDEVRHSAANAITVSSSALSAIDLLAGSYRGDWVSMTVDITGNANALSPPTVTSVANVTEAPYLGYFGRAVSRTSRSAAWSSDPPPTSSGMCCLYRSFVTGPFTSAKNLSLNQPASRRTSIRWLVARGKS